MKKIKNLCICIIILGVGLFLFTYLFTPAESTLFRWCIGLASALIILGFGYLINVLLLLHGGIAAKHNHSSLKDSDNSLIKEKSGYLVCKAMNILLCIYLLILNELKTPWIIMMLSITLVILQFVLDLILQVYFICHNNSE